MRIWETVMKKSFNVVLSAMKNRLVSFMALAATVAALASCNKAKEEEVPVVDGAYQYRFEIVDNGTRATLAGKGGVMWEEGDQVGMFLGSEAGVADVDVESTPKTLVISSGTPIPVGTKVYAYYPYAESASSNEATPLFINPVQKGGNTAAMPMVNIPIELAAATTGTNGAIKFMNMGAVINFHVYSETEAYQGETVKSITFEASSDIAGTANVNLTSLTVGDEEQIPATLDWSGSKKVRLIEQDAAVAATKDASEDLYMVVAPFTDVTGTVTVETNAATYTFTFDETKKKSISRNMIKIYSMNLKNATRTAAAKTYTYSSTLSAGTWLITANEGNATYLRICKLPEIKDSQNGKSIDYIELGGVSKTVSSYTTAEENIISREVVLEQASEGKWYIKVKSTGKYLYPSDNYTPAFADAPTDEMEHYLDGTTVKCGDYTFYHSTTEQGFTYQKNKSAQNLRFMKLSDASSQSQSLTFNKGGASYSGETFNIYNSDPSEFVEPTLEGFMTTVTYSSNAESIAKVDSQSGKVTLMGETGTVTITATAAAEGGYSSATASYTITVMSSDPDRMRYEKVEAIEDAGTYLIVSSENKAFKPILDGEVFTGSDKANAIDVTIDGNVIECDEALKDCEVAIFAAGDGYEIKDIKSGYYLSFTTSTIDAKAIKGNAFAFTYASNAWTIGSATGGLYYSTNSDYFRADDGTSSLSIYKLVGNGVKKNMNLSFTTSPENVEYIDNLVVDLQAVTGNVSDAAIGYESDNEIAAINSDKVSFSAKGRVTITATAEAKGEYASAKANYVIVASTAHHFLRVNTIEANATYLIVNESSSTQGLVFKPVVSNNEFSNSNNTVSQTINNNVYIAGSEELDGYQFGFELADQTAGTYHLKTVGLGTNYYLYLSQNKMAAQTNTPGTSYVFKPAFGDDGTVTLKRNSNNNYLAYTSNSFRYNGSAAGNIALYKYVDGAPKNSQSLSFASEAVNWKLGEDGCAIDSEKDLQAPTCDNANATITYSVPANNGVVEQVSAGGKTVRIIGAGTVVVTATASADGYYDATATYTLSIVDPSKVEYVKVTSITSGGTYIIVNESAKRAFKPILSSDKSTFLQTSGSGNAESVTITDNKIETGTSQDACQVVLFRDGTTSNYFIKAIKAENYWLSLKMSGNNYSITASATKSTSVPVSGSFTFGSTNNGYFNYSSSSNYFRNSNSNSNRTVALYQLTGGSTKLYRDYDLSFNVSEVTYNKYDSGASYSQPTLTNGGSMTVSYRASSEDVQFGDNGAISNLSSLPVGEYTITAYIAGDSDYNEVTASYKLNVVNQAPQTYTLVTNGQITDGGTYLIVSALSNHSTNGVAGTPVDTYAHKLIFAGTTDGSYVSVNPAASNGVITGDYSDYEFVISKKANDSNNTYEFSGKNGYLYWTSSGNTYIGMGTQSNSNLRLDTSVTAATGNENAFFFGAVKTNATEISEYLYHNDSGSGSFKIGGTGKSCGVYLYKKDVTTE